MSQTKILTHKRKREHIATRICVIKGLVILFLSGLLQLHTGTVFAQTITISGNNLKIEKVFREIKKQTGYNVLCSSTIIRESPKINVKLRNTPLRDALSVLLQPIGLKFQIRDHNIVITRDETSKNTDRLNTSYLTYALHRAIIHGVVRDTRSQPLAGVSVTLKGGPTATMTDDGGSFRIEAAIGGTLIFSSVGFEPLEITIDDTDPLDIVMDIDVSELTEVVVTALGIKQEEKTLGYSIQKVQGSILQTAKEPNVMSNLTGKVAGLNIQNPPGLYETPTISLRGSSDVLMVIDNVPIASDFWDISPDDIEEMSILKGPAAAALYGSRGQNGAILITTKRGGGKENIEISVNSSNMFQSGYIFMPKTQKKYGDGEWGMFEWSDGNGGGLYDANGYSWGPKMNQPDPNTPSGFVEIIQWDSPIDPQTGERIPTPFINRGDNNVKNFFQTGHIFSNNVSFGATTEKANFRFSLTQMDQKGNDPNTKIDVTTVSISGGYKFSDKISFESALNYNKQYSDNYPRTSYFSDNNMYNILVWMPNNIDVTAMKDYWEPGQEGIRQRTFNYAYYNNPYFIAKEFLQEYKKDVVYGFASLSFQLKPGLKLIARSKADWYTTYSAEKRPKGFVGYDPDYINGGFYPDYIYNFELNNEFLLTYDKSINDNWDLNAVAGGNSRDSRYRSMYISVSSLSIPGVYNIGNAAVPISGSNYQEEKLVNSLFGSAKLGYRKGLYLAVTGRNDWSSGMPVKNNSYFYPSVSFSGLISKFVSMPEFVSLAKVRAAWIRVGGDMSPYSSRPAFSYGPIWGGTPSLYLEGTLYPESIEPDFKNTIELGGDLQFFRNRLGFDLTYYRDMFTNAITSSSISTTSGFNYRLINSDKKWKRKGWEAILTANPISNKTFNWGINLNWSRTREFLVKAETGKNGRDGYVKEGGMYGEWIFRNEIDMTPDGQVIYKDGFPAISTGLTNYGFGNNKWIAGLGMNFRYKNWFLSFSVDGRWGGLLYSRLNQKLWESGKHIDSAPEEYRDADIRDEKAFIGPGVVVVSGEARYDAEGFLISDDRKFAPNETKVYYWDWASSYYNQSIYGTSIFDATYMKLRELVISYRLPKDLLKRSFVKDIVLSLIGRNLLLWTKENSNMDPDVKGGPGEARLYVPTPRNIGFNVKLKF